MRLSIILSLFLVWASFAQEKALSKDEVFKNLLPEKIKSFQLVKTSREDVHKVWGKPDLTERNKDYYILEGVKYPVEFTFDKGNRLKKMYYRFVGEKTYTYQDLKPLVENLPMVDAAKNLNSKGIFFLIKVPEKRAVLKFRNNDKKGLDTLIIE